jgi:glycerol-3-phosphate acyltransferase PlsY
MLDKTGAAATLAFDAAKGALAVWIAYRLVPQDWAGGVAFLMVVVGHIWPVQLSFRGGKGAAPGLGCVLVIDPSAALMALAGGALLFAVSRNITAGGLTAVALAPAVHALFGATWADAAAVATACTLILIAHHPTFDRRRVPATSAGEEVQGSSL